MKCLLGVLIKIFYPTPTSPQISKFCITKAVFLLKTHINLGRSINKIHSQIGNSARIRNRKLSASWLNILHELSNLGPRSLAQPVKRHTYIDASLL